MKRLATAVMVVFFGMINVFGQAPGGFKYQAVIRDADGEVMANQQVELTLEIRKGSASGEVVCSEVFTPSTNEFGLVNIEAGSHDPGAFEAIDWSAGPYYLQVILNGIVMGASEILSVPYALYAKNSGNEGLWMSQGNNIYYSKGSVGIGSGLINSSSLLELTSSTKGFLPPRMTYEQIISIAFPADGLIVFCTDCEANGLGALSMYMYGGWYKLCSTCLGPTPPNPAVHDTSQVQITWNWHPVTGAIGYKWNTTDNYSTATDMGTDTSRLEEGLTCGTYYSRYLWAYSANCVSGATIMTETTAPCDTPLPCPGIPYVIYEGKTYNTVLIGDQCWLRENLDVGVRIDGEIDQSDNEIIEKYCYDDNPANCEIYGGLYQWEEIMKYTTAEGTQGICPDGWHIPTDGEWCTLATFIDETVVCDVIGGTGTDACLKMKSTSGWNGGGNGTNESGFTSLPSGVRYETYYAHIGNGTDFWTSTMHPLPGGYYWVNYYSNDHIGRYLLALSWNCSISVRCIKDE